MRRYGIVDAYEQLKEFTRGEKIDQALLLKFIDNLKIDGNVKADLRKLTPNNYIGLAKELAIKESL